MQLKSSKQTKSEGSATAEDLVKLARKYKAGTNAARLWKASRERLPEAIQDLMSPKGRSWRQIRDLVDQMRNHTDGQKIFLTLSEKRKEHDYLDIQLSERVKRQADLDERSAEDVHNMWQWAANVIHDAAIALNPQYESSASNLKHAELDTCLLCWRTAPRSRHGKYFCIVHCAKADNQAYKDGRLLLRWRPPLRANVDHSIYIFRRRRELLQFVPSQLRAPPKLTDFRSGHRERQIGEPFPKIITIEPTDYWPKLCFLKKFIGSRANKLTSLQVLMKLDPVIPGYERAHREYHDRFIKDQRFILDMMIRAEAWLDAKQYKLECHGGYRIGSGRRRHKSGIL